MLIYYLRRKNCEKKSFPPFRASIPNLSYSSRCTIESKIFTLKFICIHGVCIPVSPFPFFLSSFLFQLFRSSSGCRHSFVVLSSRGKQQNCTMPRRWAETASGSVVQQHNIYMNRSLLSEKERNGEGENTSWSFTGAEK